MDNEMLPAIIVQTDRLQFRSTQKSAVTGMPSGFRARHLEA
jgi:hypothetical protein